MIKIKTAGDNNVRQEMTPAAHVSNYIFMLAKDRTISQTPFLAAFM